MTTPASAADIGILSACAFLGNIGASLTGFGQAIIFLFIWQIVELAGYNGDFSTAVFIQALSLFSMQPVVLWTAKVWIDANFAVLWLFVPITLISTPLGQMIGYLIPTNIVQAVAGILVILVACWELYSKRSLFVSICKRVEDESGDDGDKECLPQERKDQDQVINDAAAKNHEVRGNVPEAVDAAVSKDENKELDPESLFEKDADETISNSNKTEGNEHPSNTKKTISSVYTSLAVESNEISSSAAPQNDNTTTETTEEFKIGLNKATFVTVLAGGLSGFLGGMVAIRGPPLIFYFLHPPHPISFNKRSQRATGVVIMFCNVLMREIYYLVDTFSSSDSEKIGFVKDDWRLYLSVIVCSIAGGLIGSKLFVYIKDSQTTIRGILAVFLLLCGVSLLFSAFA